MNQERGAIGQGSFLSPKPRNFISVAFAKTWVLKSISNSPLELFVRNSLVCGPSFPLREFVLLLSSRHRLSNLFLQPFKKMALRHRLVVNGVVDLPCLTPLQNRDDNSDEIIAMNHIQPAAAFPFQCSFAV